MELKKNPKYDVYRHSKLFFSIGLATSMLMVTAVFEWKTYEDEALLEIASAKIDQYEDILEIPPTTQPPPPPPQQVYMPNIVEVPDEEIIITDLDINLDIEIRESTIIEEYDYTTFVDEAPEKEAVEEIFMIVEDYPEPVGGMQSFYEYVATHLEYPAIARANSISGKVFIEFIIKSDGTMKDIKVLKGIGGGCDEEAVRVIKASTAEVKWNAGKQRGVPVNVKMVLPLTFSLD
ncbi:MAG: energy transducer TonB [Cyclobacteriaceae bacterium]